MPPRTRRLTRGRRAAAVAALSLLALPGSAFGATITVNTTADVIAGGGSCSLREAVISANTNAGGSGCTSGSLFTLDTIVVPARATHYVLDDSGADEDD